MADLQKTIEIVFGAVDDVSGSVDSINKKISDMSGAIGSATDPLASVHDGVIALEAGFAALAAGGLALAYAKSMEFEGALVELEKVLGEGDLTGLDTARQEAIALSETYGESATSILSSIADFKQAGFTLDEAMQLTKNSMDLVIAGGVDAAQSSDLLVASLKGFKEPASEAARLVDILNETSNNYATDVEQLAIGMAKLSPISSQFGLSMEETAGVLTPVIEVFRSGDEAATALKTGLLKLIDDSKPVQDALASIGVSQTDANGALRSGKDILLDVSQAFVGLDDSQKLFVTQQLVGIEQSARMVEVFDQLSKTSEVTATAMDSSGSAAAEVAKRLEAAEVQVRIFKESFNNLATVIGNQFKAAATKAIAGGSEIAQALKDSVEGGAFDEIFDVFEQFFDDLAGTLSGMAEALPEALEEVDFKKFTASLQSVRDEAGDLFSAFFDDIDLTTPEGLAEGIQKIVDASASLNSVVAGVIDGWERWAEWLGKIIDKFGDLDASTAENIGQTLQLGKEINVLSDIFGGLSGALDAAGNLMNALAVKQVAGLITSFGSASTVTGSWSTAVNALAGTAGGQLGLLGVSYAIGNLAGKLASEFIPWVDDAAQAVIGWADELFNFSGTQDKATDSAEGFDRLVTALADSTKDFQYDLSGLRSELTDLGYDIEGLPDEAIFRLAAEADILSVDDAHALIKERIDLDPPVASIYADVEDFDNKITAFWDEFLALPDEKNVDINVKADTDEVEQAQNYIKWFDETGTEHVVYIEADSEQVDIAGKKIDDLPSTKMLEIQLQGDIDTQIAAIEAQAETAQEAFKYKAEVDIAEAEATAQILTSAYAAAGQSVEALSASTSDMFGSLAAVYADLDLSEKWDLTDILEKQMEIEEKMVDSQIKLNEAQAEMVRAKTEALERGDAQIQIDSTGLEPALEMILWQVIEKVQIRANESSADFLLGLNS